MMTAYQTIPNAVQAIRHGAEDYIVKEASLAPILERVLELRQRAQLREEALGTADAKCQGLLGCSRAMRLVIDELSKVAVAKDTTLLLTGETGVGKEVACRFVHSLSRPAGSPLVVVDCLALPENLAESLLFGHERGAFTGAQESQIGAFEKPATARFSSTRSAIWNRVRESSYAYSRAAPFAGWDPVVRFRLGPAWSPLPTRTCLPWCKRAAFARISSNGLRSSRSASRPCANAGRHSALGGALPHPLR